MLYTFLEFAAKIEFYFWHLDVFIARHFKTPISNKRPQYRERAMVA